MISEVFVRVTDAMRITPSIAIMLKHVETKRNEISTSLEDIFLTVRRLDLHMYSLRDFSILRPAGLCFFHFSGFYSSFSILLPFITISLIICYLVILLPT